MNPDRSFCCNNCTKVFKLSWHLKNNEKACKGEKVYVADCKLCNKKFTTKFILQDTKNMFSKERIPM